MMNNINNLSEPKYNTFVIFEQSESKQKTLINCNTKDKLKEVIYKYRIKLGDPGDFESYIYLRNNQILNLEKTVEENGIETNNGRVILCINTKNVRGGNNNK